MQLTVLPLAALAGLASAQKVHIVNVGKGGALGTAAYSPDTITAAVGDMVQWQFAGGMHSVVQSNFDDPCVPIENINKSMAGFYSGTMQASGSTTDMATFSVMINSTAPMWIYCAVATHCQDGMGMVINENTAANASRSLANYRSAAQNTKTIVPASEAGGTLGTSSGSSNSSSGSSGSGSGSSATPSGSSNGTAAAGGATGMTVPSTFGFMAALAAVFML